MLLILPYLVLWTISLEGLGRLVLVSCAAREGADDPILGAALSGVLGLGTACVAGAMLNLFFPLGVAAACVALATGLLGLRVAPPRWTREALSIRAAIVLVAALAASKSVRHYDTGLYHLPTVLWEQAQALPRGLANLHPRFGFNTLWDAGIPLLALPGAKGHVAILAAPLVLGFWGMAAATSALALWRGRPSLRAWFMTATAVPWYYAAVDIVLPSASNDLPLEAITFLTIAALLPGRTEAEGENRSAGLEAAGLLAAIVAVAVKLSGAPLAASILCVLLLRERSGRRAPVARVLASGALVAAVLLIRGLLLSGCVAFPAASTCIAGLPWAVPAETARAAAAGIRDWARLAGQPAPPGTLGWIVPWLARNSADPQLRTWAVMGTAGLLLVVTGIGRRLAFRAIRAPLLVAASLVVFGLATAPDPRFFLGGLFALAILPLALGADALAESPLSARAYAALTPALVSMTIAVHSVKPLHWKTWPPWPSVALRVREIDGVDVRMPPAGSDQCWTAAPPCAADDAVAVRIERSADGTIREIRAAAR